MGDPEEADDEEEDCLESPDPSVTSAYEIFAGRVLAPPLVVMKGFPDDTLAGRVLAPPGVVMKGLLVWEKERALPRVVEGLRESGGPVLVFISDPVT